MKWFKLWTEARNDGKLRALSDYEHRIWFRLLCYAAEQEPAGAVRASWKLLAAECADGGIEPLKAAVTEMQSLQLVTVVTCNDLDVTLAFHSFEKRQSKFPSNDKKRVAERVAKHRARKRLRQQELPISECNEHVTSGNDPETETDIEEEIPPLAPLEVEEVVVAGTISGKGDRGRNEPGTRPIRTPSLTPELQEMADSLEGSRPGEGWGPWLLRLCVGYKPSWVLAAIRECLGSPKFSKQYVNGALQRYQRDGPPPEVDNPPPSRKAHGRNSDPPTPKLVRKGDPLA